MSTFMRNKTAMNDNLQMVEDRLKTYDVNKIVELGILIFKKIFD